MPPFVRHSETWKTHGELFPNRKYFSLFFFSRMFFRISNLRFVSGSLNVRGLGVHVFVYTRVFCYLFLLSVLWTLGSEAWDLSLILWHSWLLFFQIFFLSWFFSLFFWDSDGIYFTLFDVSSQFLDAMFFLSLSPFFFPLCFSLG